MCNGLGIISKAVHHWCILEEPLWALPLRTLDTPERLPINVRPCKVCHVHAGGHSQQKSLIRSSGISTLPWDLGRAKPAVPGVPGHLAVPELMERAGNAAFYDEPELGRTTPPVQRPTSQFTHTGAALHVTP